MLYMFIRKMTKLWFLINVLFSFLSSKGWAERVLGTETDEFDFDGLPGAQHEFKIEVGAGKEECFYQKIVAGGKLHISFEVLYGGNMQLTAYIRNPDIQRVVDIIHNKPEGLLMHNAQFTVLFAPSHLTLAALNIDQNKLRIILNYFPWQRYFEVAMATLLYFYLRQMASSMTFFRKLIKTYVGDFSMDHSKKPVLRGGDQSMDFYIKGVSGQILQEARTRPRWIAELDTNLYAEARPMTEEEIDGVMSPPVYRGPYAICLDNTMSRMASKLVYVFLVTYVEEEWSQYRKEIEDVELTVSNFTESIQKVHESVKDALVHQAQSRMHVIKDWYLITGNNTYIQRWSICQCIVILMCSGVQVYFVRRLFRGTNVTPSAKPRA